MQNRRLSQSNGPLHEVDRSTLRVAGRTEDAAVDQNWQTRRLRQRNAPVHVVDTFRGSCSEPSTFEASCACRLRAVLDAACRAVSWFLAALLPFPLYALSFVSVSQIPLTEGSESTVGSVRAT